MEHFLIRGYGNGALREYDRLWKERTHVNICVHGTHLTQFPAHPPAMLAAFFASFPPAAGAPLVVKASTYTEWRSDLVRVCSVRGCRLNARQGLL